jgi:hypothetical protein|tara:strand:- start:789 stop:1208 length:420 start_codon:yes stop_codon:yes gene_type:complete
MKSFKQHNEAVQVSTEDETHASFNIQDPVALQKLNGFVGALAEQEYLQPDAAIHQMAMKLGTVGLQFALPKIEGNGGKTVVELTQFGGRYGKTPENTTSGDGDIENGDGISHRKEGGLKLEFKWERQENNTYKVFANLI